VVPGDAIGNAIAKALRELLHDSHRRPALVLCAMRSRSWQQMTAPTLSGSFDPIQHARALLTGSGIVVPDTFTAEEVERAMTSGDPVVADAAAHAPERYVIQYLRAIPELETRFDTGTPDQRAVIQCAIDARNAGHGLWIPAELLEHGARCYLSARDRSNLPQRWFDDAIAELTRRGSGEASLLVERRADYGVAAVTAAFRLADHMERRWISDVEHPPLPSPYVWSALVTHAAPASLARECWPRQMLRESCMFCLRAAEGDEAARLEFAGQLRRARRFDDALAQLDPLISSGDITAALEAATILLAEDRPGEVITLLEPWIASEHNEAIAFTAMAYSKRAELVRAGKRACGERRNRGVDDRNRALSLYQRLGEKGDLQAALAYADMLTGEAGDADDQCCADAAAWLRRLADEQGLDTVGVAAELLVRAHGPNAALEMLQIRATRENDRACYLVGAQILADHNRDEEALEWVTCAAENEVQGARLQAAKMCAEAGLFGAAVQHAEHAAITGDCTAFIEVGDVFAARRLPQRSMDCFRRAAESGDASAWAKAARTAAEAGWLDDATGLVRRAHRATGSPDAQLVRDVAVALCRTGQADDTIPWYLQHADTGASDVLVSISKFLLDANVAKIAVAAYMRDTRVTRGQACVWLAEGLVRADAHDQALATRRRTTTSVEPTREKLSAAAEWFLQAQRAGFAPALVRAVEVHIDLRRFDTADSLLETAEHTSRLDTCRAIVRAHHGKNLGSDDSARRPATSGQHIGSDTHRDGAISEQAVRPRSGSAPPRG
jgi:tetratricopeptide (TPR) repeat protein